tara:strand:+ start:418 stop:1092 length:675 start_codon:yes stop_codon:yes gene_type:complete
MKVAIIMAGDLRDFAATYPYLKNNVMSQQDCDIYMHCYNSEYAESALDLYLPKKYLIENKEEVSVEYDDICNTHTFPEVNVSAGFYQWRNVKKAFELIDPKSKYDFVIRNRYDLAHLETFSVENLGLNPNDFNIPDGGDYRRGIYDQFAASSYDNMKYYCSMYDVMSSYTSVEKVPSHSEILLRHHLNKSEANINRIDIDMYLRQFYKDTQMVENRFFNARNAC